VHNSSRDQVVAAGAGSNQEINQYLPPDSWIVCGGQMLLNLCRSRASVLIKTAQSYFTAINPELEINSGNGPKIAVVCGIQ
jgi:hypothetical protein